MGLQENTENKARSDSPDFHELEDATEPHSDSESASSLRRLCWPQSYRRSMGLLFPSPPPRSSPPLLTRQIPELIPNPMQSGSGCGCGLTEARLPLLNGGVEFERNGADMESSHMHHSNSTRHSVEHSIDGSQQGQSSFLQTFLNGANVLTGVAILPMPYAVSQGGWIGLSFLVIFGMVCCYTGILLRRCLDLDPLIVSYPDVGQASFGRFGRILMCGLLYLELFCVSVEFLILEGDNLSQLFAWEGLHCGGFQLRSEQAFLIVSSLAMLPTTWVRDLSVLSYISAGGVLACLTVLLTVAWEGIIGTGFTSNRGHVLNVRGFPIAVGLYAYCFCGHAVFPTLYGSMRDKSKFTHVLIACFILCGLTYGCMAVLGFLMYGDTIKSQVTLSLPSGKLAMRVAVVAIAVSTFTKYGLTVTPLAAGLELLIPKSWNLAVWGVIIRTLLVASTTGIALALPFFAYIMALVGSSLSTTVAITMPCLCYMKLFSSHVPLWERVLLCLFLGLALTACVAGTYSSLSEIASEMLPH